MTRRLAATLVAFTAAVLLLSVLPLGLATAARDRLDYRTGTADLARSLTTLADEAFDNHTAHAVTPSRLRGALGAADGAMVVDARGRTVVTAGMTFNPPRALLRRALRGDAVTGLVGSANSSPVAAAPVTEGTQV